MSYGNGELPFTLRNIMLRNSSRNSAHSSRLRDSLDIALLPHHHYAFKNLCFTRKATAENVRRMAEDVSVGKVKCRSIRSSVQIYYLRAYYIYISRIIGLWLTIFVHFLKQSYIQSTECLALRSPCGKEWGQVNGRQRSETRCKTYSKHNRGGNKYECHLCAHQKYKKQVKSLRCQDKLACKKKLNKNTDDAREIKRKQKVRENY